jgi:hypothetical protein
MARKRRWVYELSWMIYFEGRDYPLKRMSYKLARRAHRQNYQMAKWTKNNMYVKLHPWNPNIKKLRITKYSI